MFKKKKWIMCSLQTPRPICRSTSRPTYRSRCRSTYRSRLDRFDSRHLDRYIGRGVLVEHQSICRPICRPVSLDYQCQIYNLYVLCLDHVRKFSRYQARHLSEILPNTENMKKKKQEKRKGKAKLKKDRCFSSGFL